VSCDVGNFLLHSYFDRELSGGAAAEFERHVLHCVDCAEELVALDFLRDRLQLAQLDDPAPASLRRKIRVDVGLATATVSSQPLLWHWLAAAAALFFVAIVLWRVTPAFRNNDYQAELAEEIVDAHIRSLKPGQATGVASNDQHVVKGWFESTLKFPVPVRDFANEGFALRGGRVDAVEGRPFAALVYVRDGHLINVFIWPTGEPDTSPRAGSRQGYQWIDWRKGKLEFCAVSDASPTELGQLYQLIAEQASSTHRSSGHSRAHYLSV
jgi:anti-sigma factor RsiW